MYFRGILGDFKRKFLGEFFQLELPTLIRYDFLPVTVTDHS
jgi:hypothetical protein